MLNINPYIFILLFLSIFKGSLANGDILLNLDSCKFCNKTIKSVQLPIWKNNIHFTPIIAWNNADKTQLGIAFYSKPKLENLDFVIAPMFGLGSKNLTGLAKANYNLSFKNSNEKMSFGIHLKRFSHIVFPEDLAYNKVEPSITFQFKPSKIKKLEKHSKSLQWRSSFIFFEHLTTFRNTEFYYVNELKFKYDFNKKTNNIWFEAIAKQGKNFGLLSAEINTNITYPTRKRNALHIRLFGGGFIFTTFDGTAPNAKLLLSGSTNHFTARFQKDFQLDQLYFDRNAQDPFFSKQVTLIDGAFRSVTSLGNSSKYLLALNICSDIPIPIPIETWVNLAMIDDGLRPNFAAEAGASVNLFDGFLQFHFPFITTKNIVENQKLLGITNFGKRISFSLDLMKLDALRKR